VSKPRTLVLTDKKGDFDVVDKYYRMFPQDVSSADYLSLQVADVQRLADFSFQGLMEAMLINRDYQWTEIDNFLIVSHGLYAPSLKMTNGLLVPLHKGSQILMDARNLDYLLKLANDPDANAAKFASEEKIQSFKTRYGSAYLPKGKLGELITMMRDLRKKRVRRITFRACDIGKNVAAMSTIGQCFGALFAEGPNVHMFYIPADVFHMVDDMGYEKVARQAGMRGFINGSDTSQEFAIKVMGTGPNRTKQLYSTTPTLRWFIDSYLCPGSSYPTFVTKGSKPPPFFITGMDVTAPGGAGLALPLEREWSQHIVWTDPLPGNMIGVKS